ncbi:MAG: M61 family peptidase, partial [Calditrichaeota bacterium]
MKYRVFLLLVFLSISIAFGQTAVHYSIAFPNRDHHEAEVEIMFTQIPGDVLHLHMSRSSPGRYALHEFAKNVYNVKAFDSKGKRLRVTRPNPHRWDVHGHDGTVKVSYTIFGDRCDGTYLAVDNTHAHINMPATFMWAEGMTDQPVDITFHRPDPNWHIATQLAPTDKPETFTAPNLQYFMDSPTEVGPFEMRSWTLRQGEREVTFRLALHHSGTDAELTAFADLIRTVVEEEIALFGEAPPYDYGTYTFIADYLPYVNGDGMEHRNSTILTSTRTLRKQAVRNLFTVAHEFFHAWNVERIRPRSLEPFDFDRANMSGELWFAEGFTSYYDGLILKRAGLISLDRFAEDLGRTLNQVLNAPGRKYFSPVEMSMQAPFADAAVSIDPKNQRNTFISYYPYGAALGLALDLTLRRRFPGKSLDDFMAAMWQAHGKPEQPYTLDDLRRTLGEAIGDQEFADDFFRRYVSGRELPDFKSLLAAAGFTLEKKNPDKAWLGSARLDFSKGKVGVRTTTQMGSPLYQAGVDRKDSILTLDGQELRTQDDLDTLLAHHKPGDQVEIVFEKRGQRRQAKLTFQADPMLKVVPAEHKGA